MTQSEHPPVALLIEDEPQIRRFVRTALEPEGWRVFEADTMKRGLVEAGTRKPDLIILDLGLPDGDGIEFIVQIRKWSTVPIIILSARVTETDKIQGLDAGADDYLTKPFGLGELLARVRAALRRRRQSGAGATERIRFGDVDIDLRARLVSKAGQVVRLTPTEYRLISVLIVNSGRVVTNMQLLREVWGPSHADSSHYVRIYMGHLRQKLEDDPAQPRFLLTEPAVGYRLLLTDQYDARSNSG
ncbi:MAG TPA: two-component system response regulator KdpE [Burkholderiaceae bacterium]|nr:two-component system response regulator KdpE [Burkholderiaceae bacterium]